MHSDWENPYLTQQAITYLGNKRKHLSIIDTAIAKIVANDAGLSRRLAGGTATAADPFSGSGIVGRLLRTRNFTVYASDIESYTLPINKAWLSTKSSMLEKYFESPAKWLARRLKTKCKSPYYDWTLQQLNKLSTPDRAYFSKYYAPQKTVSPCSDTERLFYTQENARRLDCWMELLHKSYWKNHPEAWSILVAGVLHLMTTNINTSGTMKAFHRNGWGGSTSESLCRIMAPMCLQPMPLIDGPIAAVACADAKAVPILPNGLVDVVFLDPPSHQHHYGSNYHLLTSFCNNGKYIPDYVRHGTRAGIPPDHYKSPYGKSREAQYELADLVEFWSKNSRYMILTYESNGLLTYDEIFNILQNDGNNKVDFVKYDNSELMFIVSTKTKVSTHFHDIRAEKMNIISEFVSLKDKYIDPAILKISFKIIATRDGWAVFDNAVNLFSIRKDYKVVKVNISTFDLKTAATIKQAILDNKSLLKKYYDEQLWEYVLKIVVRMKKTSDILYAQNYLMRMCKHAITHKKIQLLKRIDIACGKVLHKSVVDLLDSPKRS